MPAGACFSSRHLVAEVAIASRLVRVNPVTVNDVLDGHVQLGIDCLDRVYLHGYLAQLQVGGQVVQFLRHRGFPVPSMSSAERPPTCIKRQVLGARDVHVGQGCGGAAGGFVGVHEHNDTIA